MRLSILVEMSVTSQIVGFGLVCGYVGDKTIFEFLFLQLLIIIASIFLAFYFLQKIFAKLVFFANKKQKKAKKIQQHI